MITQRTTAISGHLAVLAVSFVLSLAVFSGSRLMNPGGKALDAAFIAILFTHAVALAICLFVPRITKLSSVVIFLIAFSFSGCLLVDRIRDWHYLRFQAPYDRFRDWIVPTIPKSVVNLRFVGMDEGVRLDPMLQFDIDPADLELLLQDLKLKRVSLDELLDPKDLFKRSYYMTMAGNCEMYQGRGKYENVLTIKTNKAHSHAIFRSQSPRYYEEHQWEGGNPDLRQLEDEALSKLKARFEAQRGAGRR
jgi:hypothetical protein